MAEDILSIADEVARAPRDTNNALITDQYAHAREGHVSFENADGERMLSNPDPKPLCSNEAGEGLSFVWCWARFPKSSYIRPYIEKVRCN